MIPNLVYNMGTGVLRAIGDSSRPLYFLIAASLCNIVLDLVLVLGLDMGVAGVAIATVASQVLSAALVLLSLTRADGQPYQLFLRQLRIDRRALGATLRVGVPAAMQSVMYNVSNIVIQSSINSFGTDTVAAWSAYGKMDMIFWMSINTMGLTITTFAGQNYGAGKIDRLKKGVRVCVGMSAGFTAALSATMVLLARPLLSIFTPDPEVLVIGVDMVYFLVPTYITYILVEILAGAIRGTGEAVVPMIISIFGVCVLRLVWLFTGGAPPSYSSHGGGQLPHHMGGHLCRAAHLLLQGQMAQTTPGGRAGGPITFPADKSPGGPMGRGALPVRGATPAFRCPDADPARR